MKTIFKTLCSAVTLMAAASTAFAESYDVNSVDGKVKISISLQGGGKATIPGPGIALPPGGLVGQHLALQSDNTLVGSIYYRFNGSDLPLFNLTGAWYRPTGSKVIYFAIDGDPTKGQASDGTWGALFDPAKATLAALPDFMPILFGKKVSSIVPIYPAVKLKTGVIKLKLAGGQITGASTNMTITGRAMVSYCKMDKAADPTCSIPNGVKDGSFGFSSITKSTVTVL